MGETGKESQSRFFDISHTVENGLGTYPDFPAPVVCDFMSREASRAHYAPGTEFQVGKIEMVANTGTYVDAPFHRFADGKDLSGLELSSLANLKGVLVHAHERTSPAIGITYFEDTEVAGKAVLVRTDWSVHWKTNRYFEGHPYLTGDAAEYLRTEGAVLVGIDSLNIDDTNDGRRPVHTTLLGNGIPVVEHLTRLGSLPDRPFRFFAVPVKVKGMGSFPVRAFAMTDAGR